MFQQLWRYYSFPWHGIEVPVKHQFHGHTLLQRLLIQAIRRLTEEMKDPIELELVPLPIRPELAGKQPIDTPGNTLGLLSQPKRLQTEDGNEAPPAKRARCGSAESAENTNIPWQMMGFARMFT